MNGAPTADELEEGKKVFAEAWMELGREVTRSLAQLGDALAPLAAPKNLPCDPSMRKDRRKWGGK